MKKNASPQPSPKERGIHRRFILATQRLWMLLFILLCAGSSVSMQVMKVRTLRLTSYNIQHGAGLDGKIDHARQAKILRKAHADVAAIQEVDSVTKRNGGLYSLEEIGRKAKMFSTFAPAIKFQGGKYGIGILSKKKPISVHRIPLPGREEPRMLLVAEFKHYVVACTHLSLTDEDRMASVPIIVEEARKWTKPFILTGDLNDEPGMPFYKEMQKHFLFLNPSYDKTFPADVPNICIDHVALFMPTPEATLSFYRTWVGEETFSDHRPLHAKIGLWE
ncbi:MAG: endonuclease/exonuclease/phosphatase family protein [Bacteroidaceae bacterium]|nr:endonuclease/exonuclease/phosphatase family protein [Bacteroidaceae bacterium]